MRTDKKKCLTKKILLAALSLTCLLSISAFASGCKETGGETSSSIEQDTGLSLNVESKTLIYGETFELLATYAPEDGTTLIWSSSNPSVATVENGTVVSVGEGETDITVTYGDESKTCRVVVTFGGIQPYLTLDHVVEDEILLSVGEDFPLSGKVQFNNSAFDCDVAVQVSDQSVLAYENGVLKAKSSGTATITVETEWMGLSGKFLKKEYTVNVFDDVNIYTVCDLNGEKTVADNISLSLVSEWAGNEYCSEAQVEIGVLVNGEEKAYTEYFCQDNGVVTFDGEKLVANKIGSSEITVVYNHGEKAYEYTLTVNVECPVVEYDELLRFETAEIFPMEEFFEEEATILSARQGDRLLTVKRNKLVGVIANGYETEPIEIQTTMGGYLFQNVFAYTRALTAENMLATLQLSSGKIVDGYYILDEDITTVVDMTAQKESFYQRGGTTNTYFSGTLDGQGHTLAFKAGLNGLLGGFGDGAIVKDIRLDITFDTTLPSSCGLARNAATWVQTKWTATLKNLYITTTNYSEHSYALMDMRFLHTVMKDIYVEINGDVGDYSKAGEGGAALFKLDASSTNGECGTFAGGFINVRVVTPKFMPMANTTWMTSTYVTYARNDERYFGAYYNDSVPANTAYCKIYANTKLEGAKPELFGAVLWFDEYVNFAWCYYARSDLATGGVFRYNSASEIDQAQIGSWTIAGDWNPVEE